MPIYEYVCKACQHQFETLVMGSRKPECPSCGSASLDKQLSVFAVSARGGSPCSREGPEACETCCESRGVGSCPLS